MFILVAISIDANDNRRHVHVFNNVLKSPNRLSQLRTTKCLSTPSTAIGSSSTNR